MRPERVRRFPAPVQAPGFSRPPRAANDNEPEFSESIVSIVIGRSLLIGAALLAITVIAGWSLWLGRAVWRHFA